MHHSYPLKKSNIFLRVLMSANHIRRSVGLSLEVLLNYLLGDNEQQTVQVSAVQQVLSMNERRAYSYLYLLNKNCMLSFSCSHLFSASPSLATFRYLHCCCPTMALAWTLRLTTDGLPYFRRCCYLTKYGWLFRVRNDLSTWWQHWWVTFCYRKHCMRIHVQWSMPCTINSEYLRRYMQYTQT